MVKRQFDEKEKLLASKVLMKKLEQIEWIEYQIKYYDLMLDEGLAQNYKKTVREFKQQRKEFEDALKMEKEGAKILQDQIRNGVDVVEKVDVKEDKTEKEVEK